MAGTLSIRLAAEDRLTLERAARDRGMGLSAFIRGLAEAEARRERRERSRAEGAAIAAYVKSHPAAQSELEDYGSPAGELL